VQKKRISPSLGKNEESTVLSPNIEINRRKPSALSFHHFKKFDSYDYDFDALFEVDSDAKEVARKMDFSTIIKEKDICLLAMGGLQSGISELC
jgi:hypothetical protein